MGIEIGPFYEDIYALTTELADLLRVSKMRKCIHV